MERRLSFRDRQASFPALSEVSVDSGIGVTIPEEENSALNLAQRDTRKVWIQRGVFIVVFLITSVVACTLVNVSISRKERDSFVNHFDDVAHDLTRGFQRIFTDKIWAAQTISVTMTSDATFRGDVWPNTLVPDFTLRTEGTRTTAESDAIVFSPLVTDGNRDSWEAYVVENQVYLDLKPNDTCTDDEQVQVQVLYKNCRTVADGISRWTATRDGFMSDPGPGPYHPGFLISSDVPGASNYVMFNYYSIPGYNVILDSMVQDRTPVITKVLQNSSILIYPVMDALPPNGQDVVGSIQLDLNWQAHLMESGSTEDGSVVVVLELGSGDVLSYEMDRNGIYYLGKGDQHDPRYDDMVVTESVSGNWPSSSRLPQQMIALSKTFSYTISVYPTQSFEAAYVSNAPAVLTTIVACIFIFALIMFFIYDRLVERRQQRVNRQAERFGKTINALFPPGFRTRLFGSKNDNNDANSSSHFHQHHEGGGGGRPITPRWSSMKRRGSNGDESSRLVVEPAKSRLRTFLSNSEKIDFSTQEEYKYDEPIADLFPETTIMFADIAGFTAWSSEREPSQVFYLLETLYRAFDKIASRLGVFKVETIGDCYVAVTGLPDQRKDHAVVMARFSYECLLEMSELVKSLEVTLGPGTSDLAIRVGLHSGPVTAGVLRGEKARFQLFGDTMNTAARMESTGEQNKIHVSGDTADALEEIGKGHWLTPRDAVVNVKGKGEMKTWWLQPRRSTKQTEHTNNDHAAIEQIPPPPESKPYRTPPARRSSKADNWGDLTLDIYGVDSDKKARLVTWNVEILSDILAKVVAWRSVRVQQQSRRRRSDTSLTIDLNVVLDGIDLSSEDENTISVIDEVSEIINLPGYPDKAVMFGQLNPDASNLPDEVKAQLDHYISRIANFYHNVPFHNLEHASHVTLSANKLMKRIISPGESDFALPAEEDNKRRMRRRRSFGDVGTNMESVERNLHQSTFGISSDPLCQLAIVFSALIHDVDHTGLPNAQLVKEKRPIAKKYNNKSVAEQNSVDIAWDILMEGQYKALRDCIFENEKEKRRFRQLVVNSVMATDIVDKELKALRENRWATAFDESKISSMSETDVNRKATIVIEHIIQASDVAHTMQHWHIYCKWNEKLFCELYTAYLSGRAEKDPSVGWYGGEIWFFDNYIIPLAKKLKECGVFGVASDEYLNYAEENRKEWERKGHKIVEKMRKSYEERHGEHANKKSKAMDTSGPPQSITIANGVKEVEQGADCTSVTELPSCPDRNHIANQSEAEQAEELRKAQQVYSSDNTAPTTVDSNTAIGEREST